MSVQQGLPVLIPTSDGGMSLLPITDGEILLPTPDGVISPTPGPTNVPVVNYDIAIDADLNPDPQLVDVEALQQLYDREPGLIPPPFYGEVTDMPIPPDQPADKNNAIDQRNYPPASLVTSAAKQSLLRKQICADNKLVFYPKIRDSQRSALARLLVHVTQRKEEADESVYRCSLYSRCAYPLYRDGIGFGIARNPLKESRQLKDLKKQQLFYDEKRQEVEQLLIDVCSQTEDDLDVRGIKRMNANIHKYKEAYARGTANLGLNDTLPALQYYEDPDDPAVDPLTGPRDVHRLCETWDDDAQAIRVYKQDVEAARELLEVDASQVQISKKRFSDNFLQVRLIKDLTKNFMRSSEGPGCPRADTTEEEKSICRAVRPVLRYTQEILQLKIANADDMTIIQKDEKLQEMIPELLWKTEQMVAILSEERIEIPPALSYLQRKCQRLVTSQPFYVGKFTPRPQQPELVIMNNRVLRQILRAKDAVSEIITGVRDAQDDYDFSLRYEEVEISVNNLNDFIGRVACDDCRSREQRNLEWIYLTYIQIPDVIEDWRELERYAHRHELQIDVHVNRRMQRLLAAFNRLDDTQEADEQMDDRRLMQKDNGSLRNAQQSRRSKKHRASAVKNSPTTPEQKHRKVGSTRQKQRQRKKQFATKTIHQWTANAILDRLNLDQHGIDNRDELMQIMLDATTNK